MSDDEAIKVLMAEIPKIEWEVKIARNNDNKEYYLRLLDAIDVAIDSLEKGGKE